MLLPPGVRRRLSPWWDRLRTIAAFRRVPGQSLSFDRELGSFVATKSINGRQGRLAVRSYREFRRWHLLGRDDKDLVMRCLLAGPPIGVFYDVGASNGIYGFAAHSIHRCKVVFVEPYTPSVETILKSAYAYIREGDAQDTFEVVPAAIDAGEGFARLEMHGPPIAGATRNTFADAAVYTGEDRHRFPVSLSQWTKGVSLDALVYDYGLPAPSVLKIDVDGYEALAIRGAGRLIADRAVQLIVVEINSEAARVEIDACLVGNGYKLVCSRRHHDDPNEYVGDWVYARDDAFPQWSVVAEAAKAE
jgi:FkbM family methyltransferase